MSSQKMSSERLASLNPMDSTAIEWLRPATTALENTNIPCSRELQDRLFLMLQRCGSTKELHQLHAQVLLHGFSQKRFIVGKLLSSCIATGNLALAARAFTQVEEPNATLFNLMIKAVGSGAEPETSLLLYNQMRKSNVEPNGYTYSFLLNSCARPLLLPHGEQVHARIVSGGFGSSDYVQTNLVNMYAAAGGGAAESAGRVFDDMPQRNLVACNSMLAGYLRSGDAASAFRLFRQMPERNVVSWTTMIAGCVQSARCRQALGLFCEMLRAEVSPDQVTMIAALSACADMGDLELGRWIHARLGCCRRRLVSLDNTLINMYAKCGDIEEAQRIFEEMPQRSTVSWSTMIAGLVMHGRGEEALELFWMMQHTGEKPDGVTFIGVICACSHMGRIDEGRWYFNQMIEDWGIRPGIEHYGCMVDMLSRAGRLNEAQELIETMPMRANAAMWGALLNGCRMHQDVKLASHVFDRLMELMPEHVEGYLMLLSNAYSAAKRWDDVRRVRKRMMEMGVSKPAGRSWIHMNGTLHDFVAGDRTHHSARAIYRMVSEITAGAKLAGYAPDTSQVLLDVEDEDREALLHCHSEKLALAFGLISSQEELYKIRVMTNIRICSDCHLFAKFVSEAFFREIIIRDQNRFHHFVGGTCSCKDYW